MDLIVLFGIATALLAIILATWFFTRKQTNPKTESKFKQFTIEIIYLN